MIPNQLQVLFWDANPDTFNPAAYPDYTIFRILEYGDEEAVAWMRGLFSETEIRCFASSAGLHASRLISGRWSMESPPGK